MYSRQEIVDILTNKHGYKLKGVGPLSFHLGCNFKRDPDGTLSMGPVDYIDKLSKTYEVLFGEKPRPASSPLVKNDHPEVDDSQELDPKDIVVYQSMIGALQ